jgi:hypothetical protein
MINGFAAEQIVERTIADCSKIKSFKVPSSVELVKIAKSCRLGRQRLEKSKPHLLREFGISYRNPKTGRVQESLDWLQVPPQYILDCVFGIDTIVIVLGYAIAIDVTANQEDVEFKLLKLKRLKPLWKALNLDRACVCLVANSQPMNLWAAMRSVTRQQEVCAIEI